MALAAERGGRGCGAYCEGMNNLRYDPLARFGTHYRRIIRSAIWTTLQCALPFLDDGGMRWQAERIIAVMMEPLGNGR